MAALKKIITFLLTYFYKSWTYTSIDKLFMKDIMSNLKKNILISGLLSLAISGSAFASADESAPAEDKAIQAALSAIKIGGGISAGYFYASNPGEDTSDDAFLLSNFLVEISSADEDLPVGFTGAFGETSTPSVLGTPENNTELKIEYAALAIKPVKALGLEMGLLQPNSGFECTYTFNNKNVILGAIASQQPYNAYGARIGYNVSGISLWGGYYKDRLDDEEYNSPDHAWEVGLSGSIAGNDFSIYDYHIAGQRNLLGAVIERSIEGVDLAFNIDYWTWDDRVKDMYGSRSSIGAAIYICPNSGKCSVPVRLEYINQDRSQIYIENLNTKHIYSATISPTWHFNDNAYVRAESTYVKADGGFADDTGNIKDSRINFAVELGLFF
jgi:hypothetical protein